jgi:hypothetical protein
MLVVCLLLTVPLGIVSREYRTSLLRQAAFTLGIERQIAKAGKGITTQIITTSGTTVIVRIDSNGMVEHIGVPLFNAVMRKNTPSPVYDCIEYAALDRSAIHTENDLLLQKIKFHKGSWQTLLSTKPTDACTITNQSDKYYQLAWHRNGREIVNMVVPIDYELLSISSRRELEKNFTHGVSHYHPASKFMLSKDIDKQLAKSDMILEMNLSNYERPTVRVTLRQWILYCESQGCTTSVKYDDSDETIVKAYVWARNKAMGYHHLIELSWKTEELESSNPKIKGKALLFIPNNDKI